MDELTAESARKIADGIMRIIPHNINIMNRFGYVIASGEPGRLNTLNMGAVHALSTMNPYIIHADTKTERRGVYLPILFSGGVVGVIGINGEIDEILPVAQITLFTAQLMLENQGYHALSLRKNAIMRDFLLEWAGEIQYPYPQGLIDRGKSLGVDIAQDYTALLLVAADDNAPGIGQLYELKLERGEVIVWNRESQLLVAVPSGWNLAERTGVFFNQCPSLCGAYSGEGTQPFSTSVRQAQQAHDLARTLAIGRRIVQYQEVCLERMLLSAEASNSVLRLQRILSECDNGGDLLDTIRVYMDKRDDITQVCCELHIHRNTLNYRLNRIEELTGKKPRKGRDLLELYLAALRLQSGSG